MYMLWSVCHCTVVFGIMSPRLTLFNLVVCVTLFRFFMHCYFRYCVYTLNLAFGVSMHRHLSNVYNNTFLSPPTIETFFRWYPFRVFVWLWCRVPLGPRRLPHDGVATAFGQVRALLWGSVGYLLDVLDVLDICLMCLMCWIFLMC